MTAHYIEYSIHTFLTECFLNGYSNINIFQTFKEKPSQLLNNWNRENREDQILKSLKLIILVIDNLEMSVFVLS